jgi:hypothetical protein
MGFNETHKQLLDMERDLYKNFLNKEDFDMRAVIGEVNLGLLADILTEEELDSNKEDFLLTLIVRFAEDVIKDVPNGQEVWESASAYDYTTVFSSLQKDVYSLDSIELFKEAMYAMFITRLFMIMPLRHDLPIETYRLCLQDGTVTLQELLIVVYILDNIGIEIGLTTASIILELVNDDEYYIVSDYPILESIKNFAVMRLKGLVDSGPQPTVKDFIDQLDDELLQ